MQKCCKCTFQGVQGTLLLQPTSNIAFKLALHFFCSFELLVLHLNIFITVGTVPTGLQTCAKVLQMYPPGVGGPPWLQSKSNQNVKIILINLLYLLAAGFAFYYFHYNCHCAYRVANLCKSAANAPSRGWGATLVAIQK